MTRGCLNRVVFDFYRVQSVRAESQSQLFPLCRTLNIPICNIIPGVQVTMIHIFLQRLSQVLERHFYFKRNTIECITQHFLIFFVIIQHYFAKNQTKTSEILPHKVFKQRSECKTHVLLTIKLKVIFVHLKYDNVWSYWHFSTRGQHVSACDSWKGRKNRKRCRWHFKVTRRVINMVFIVNWAIQRLYKYP